MTKKEKYNAVSEAMRYTGDGKENNERAEVYLIKDTCAPEVKDILMRNIYDNNIGGSQDLGYAICADACALISEASLEELKEDSEDSYYENESASIYTDERLKYLNSNNQDEITEKVKEYACDIQTACAVWYDDMVRSVALELRDFINN